MNLRVSVVARSRVRTPQERLWSWWTDYAEGDHDGALFRALGWRHRKILERDPQGRTVAFRDEGEALGRPIHYTSRLQFDPPREILETSEGPVGAFQTRYRFEARGEWTLVEMKVEGEVEPAWARWAARIPGIPRLLAQADLDGHLRHYRRSTAAWAR